MLHQLLPQWFFAEFVSCGNYICEEGGMVHPTRTLDTFVLLVGIEGEIAIAQGESTHRLTPNTALLLFPNIEHRGVGKCAPHTSYYWCHFTLSAKNASAESGEEAVRCVPEFCNLTNPARMKWFFRYLLDISSAEHPLRAETGAHILSLLLLELAGENACRVSSGARHDVAKAEQILEWVRLYRGEITGVEDVARHFGYNKEYLTTLLRRVTGETLIAHINRFRIKEAESLLLCSDYGIDKIALLAGFSDGKYFSRVFKKKTGLTPTQYRYANLKTHCNRK